MTTAATELPYPSARYAAYVILVLLLAFLMCFLDRQIVTLLMPALKADLRVSLTQVSLIGGVAFAIVYALVGLPMGWIADRANRRNLIVAGIAFWSLATVACGLAQNFWELFAARMAVGFGQACLGPASASIVADFVRPAYRGRALSVMMAGAPVGAAGSMFIGGILLTWLAHGSAARLVPHGWAPWQVVFVIIGLPGFLVAILAATIKEPARRGERMTALSTDTAAPRLIDFFGAHWVTLLLFYGLVAVGAALAYSVSYWAPTVLMRIYGMGPAQTGAIYGTIMLLCAVIAALFAGFATDALARRWRLSGRVLIPLFVFPVEICVQITLIQAHSPVVAVAALAMSAFDMVIVGNYYYPAIQDLFPNQLRGRAVAILGLVGNLTGLGCGPTLVAVVSDRVFHSDMMLQKAVGLVGLSIACIGLLLALALPRFYARSRQRELEPQPLVAPVAIGPLPAPGIGAVERPVV